MERNSVDLQELIDDALELLGLRGRTLANFSKVSSEMKKVLGQSISPVTLYRIASPRSTAYKPFRFSVALLEEFIAQCQPQRKNYLVNNNHFHSSKNPRSSALYALLTQLLKSKKWEDIISFFGKLEVSSRSLGWERHIVAHAIGDFLRNEVVDFSKHPLGKELVKLHSFSIYYLETFIDFAHPKGYLKATDAWLANYNEHRSERQIQESVYFNLAIRPYFLRNKTASSTLHDSYIALVVNLTVDEIGAMIKHNPILMARIIGAQLLLCQIKKKKRKYDQLIDTLFSFHLNAINEHQNSFERAFCLGILLDTLIFCNDKPHFNNLLKHTNKSVFTETGDAIIYRVQAYLQIQKGKAIAEKEYVNDRFFLSDGESKLHRQLIRKVERWYLK